MSATKRLSVLMSIGGKAVNVEEVTLVRMENGKIAEEQGFIDNLEFMQQPGMIPR